ncbi:MAG: hypothetical protein E6Z80_17880 [Citrobacter freundii]|nr:hypothetical protein [Citrobacter freundii]
MNTISSLEPTDLPAAFHIEKRAHAFPWSEKTFASNQGDRLWLEVRASNAAAIALYESLGFNEATIRRNYYPTADGHEDAIIMALPISM